MLILVNDDSAAFIFEKFIGISASKDDNCVYLLANDGDTRYRIGKYNTYENAKKAVAEFFIKYGCVDKFEMSGD